MVDERLIVDNRVYHLGFNGLNGKYSAKYIKYNELESNISSTNFISSFETDDGISLIDGCPFIKEELINNNYVRIYYDKRNYIFIIELGFYEIDELNSETRCFFSKYIVESITINNLFDLLENEIVSSLYKKSKMKRKNI